MSVVANGRQVYDCDYANHCVNVKNLLEYNPSYAKSVGTNEFYFLDTTIHAEEMKYSRRRVLHGRNTTNNGDEPGEMLDDVVANYNKGFASRKELLGLSAVVNCEIPLNRYSFFEELQDKLLPNMKIDLNIELEDDKNVIWRQGAADGMEQVTVMLSKDFNFLCQDWYLTQKDKRCTWKIILNLTSGLTSGKKVIYSQDEIQNRNTVLFGYWCLYYLIERQKGKSILDVIHHKDFDEDNSDFIKDYFINHKFVN